MFSTTFGVISPTRLLLEAEVDMVLALTLQNYNSEKSMKILSHPVHGYHQCYVLPSTIL